VVTNNDGSAIKRKSFRFILCGVFTVEF